MFGLLSARGQIIVKQVYYDWEYEDLIDSFGKYPIVSLTTDQDKQWAYITTALYESKSCVWDPYTYT